MPRGGPPADPISFHFLLLSFLLSVGPAMPGGGILIKIQCAVTNRSEQSLISTRVRRGLALITAHLEETIKWIDKPFKREVNFFFFFHFTKSGFLLYTHSKGIEFILVLLTVIFFPTKILSSGSFSQRTLKLAGWVAKGLLVLFVPVLASKGTLYGTYCLPPFKDSAGKRQAVHLDPSHKNSSFHVHTIGNEMVHFNV